MSSKNSMNSSANSSAKNLLQKFRVLVVEDDHHIARLLTLTLQKAGLETQHAANGRIGLEMFETFQPHVVLLDIMMPEMDGRETCARLRKMRPRDGKPVSIIMMTSLSEAEDRITGLNLGADDYVPKPFNPAVMLARVLAQLRRAHKYDTSQSLATPSGNVALATPQTALPENWALCSACNYMAPRKRFEQRASSENTISCPHCKTQDLTTNFVSSPAPAETEAVVTNHRAKLSKSGAEAANSPENPVSKELEKQPSVAIWSNQYAE